MPRGIPNSRTAGAIGSYQAWLAETGRLYQQFQNHFETGLQINGVPPTILAQGGIILSRFAGMMIGTAATARQPIAPAASRTANQATTGAGTPDNVSRVPQNRKGTPARGAGARGRRQAAAANTTTRQRFRLRAEEKARNLTIPQAMQERISRGESVSPKLREQYLGGEQRTGTGG